MMFANGEGFTRAFAGRILIDKGNYRRRVPSPLQVIKLWFIVSPKAE